MASIPEQAALARSRTDDRAAALSGPWLVSCYAVALALMAWPIAQVANPVLADYPNHLVRLHVAAALDQSAVLSRFYVHQGGFYPYLPFDLMVHLLSRAIGLEAAGRVFIMVALALPAAGAVALARALHGRVGLWPIVSALFAYNLLLSWGLLTFLFSLGLALLVFAGWIASEPWGWPRRLPLFTALASLIFCAHPFAFAALGLVVGAWEAGRLHGTDRAALKAVGVRLFLAGLQFVPATLLATQLPRANVGSNLTQFGPAAERVAALFSPLLFICDDGELLLAGALAMAFLVALWRGVLVFDRRMVLPVAAIGVAALLTPVWVSGIYLVHIRLPQLFVLLLIASCRPRPLPARTAALALAMAAAVLALRTADVGAELARADRQVAELRAAAGAIEEGARVLPAIAEKHGGGLRAKNYWHVTGYLTIDRSAFFPLLFSFFDIGVAPDYAAAAVPASAPVRVADLALSADAAARLPDSRDTYWRNWHEKFDYVVVFDFGDATLPLPDGLALMHRGEIFAIYRIVR